MQIFEQQTKVEGEVREERRRAQCPCCRSTQVYLSRWSGWRERWIQGRRQRPYRCYECKNRFFDRVGLRSWGMPGEVMLVPPGATARDIEAISVSADRWAH